MRLPVFTRTGQGVGVLGHPPGSACSLTGILRQVHINSERFNFLGLDRRLTSIMKSFTKWDLHWLSVTRLGQGITLRQSRSPKVRNRKLSEVFESLAREKAEVHGLIHFYRREMRWDLTELFKYVLGRNNSLHVYWAEAILCILFRQNKTSRYKLLQEKYRLDVMNYSQKNIKETSFLVKVHPLHMINNSRENLSQIMLSITDHPSRAKTSHQAALFSVTLHLRSPWESFEKRLTYIHYHFLMEKLSNKVFSGCILALLLLVHYSIIHIRTTFLGSCLVVYMKAPLMSNFHICSFLISLF